MNNPADNELTDWLAQCTDRERAFVEGVAAHGKLKQAAIDAGAPAKTASNAAYAMMRRERVSKALAQRRRELAGTTGTSADAIRRELWANSKAAQAKGNIAASNRALELLGKAAGLFTDHIELTGKDGEPLGNLPELTDAELARRMALVLRKGSDSLLATHAEQGKGAATTDTKH